MRRPLSLAKGSQFDGVYSKGSVFAGPFFVLRALRSDDQSERWGFAVGKRQWPRSTDRNRIRRRLRAAAVAVSGESGWSYVLTARPRCERLAMEASIVELRRLVSKAHSSVGAKIV